MRTYFNKPTASASKSAINQFVEQVDNHLKMGATGQGFGSEIASLESWSDASLAKSMMQQLSSNQNSIDSFAQVAGLSIESYIGDTVVDTSGRADWMRAHQAEVARQSASIALEAATDPVGYMRGAVKSLEAFDARHQSTNFRYVADYTNGERASAVGIIDDRWALEAFEHNNLSAAMDYSVGFNFLAPVQEPFIEALFRTIVMSKDQVAFFYEVQLDRFWNGAKHLIRDPKTGQLVQSTRLFEKHNLMDAIRRPEILRDDVLNVVPYYDEKEANDPETGEAYKKLFFPRDKFDFGARKVANLEIPTQPLVVGQEYNLLSISAHPELLNGGVFDETDTIDSYLAIKDLLISLDGSDDKAQVVQFPLDGLERRNFIKSVQGHGFDMDLKFVCTELTIDENTKTLGDGPLPADIKGIIDAGYRARLHVEVIGSANVETSYYTLQHAKVRVESLVHVPQNGGPVRTIDPRNIDPNNGADKDALDKFKAMEVKWFTPDANRTNRNFRTQGMMVDADVFTAKIAIGVRSPVRLQRPVGSDRNYPTVEKLISFVRARQTADAFYELFKYRDTLRRYTSASMKDPARIPDFVGVGKYFIKPHYDYIRVNIMDFVKSEETKDNLENAREGLVGILQEAAARAIVESQWSIAATYLNGGKEVKPHFVIATGNYLPLLLSVKGDLRLLGANFDHTVVTSQNELMDNKIFMTIITPDAEGFSPLGFGNTFYYPELVTTVSPHAQNGAIKDTVQVSPRYQHVINLPLLIEVDVEGIREFMTTYNKYRVLTEAAPVAGAAAPATPNGTTDKARGPRVNG